MQRPTRVGGIVSVLLVFMAVAFLTFGNTPAFAMADRADPTPHAATDGPKSSHGEGCQVVGACHQAAGPVAERATLFIVSEATLSHPPVMALPNEALSEFDTPPPRA